MFVADGVKLFGKVLSAAHISTLAIYPALFLFIVALLTDVQLEVGKIVSPYLPQLSA